MPGLILLGAINSLQSAIAVIGQTLKQQNDTLLVKTSYRTFYIHEYNRFLGFRFQCLIAIEPINQKF